MTVKHLDVGDKSFMFAFETTGHGGFWVLLKRPYSFLLAQIFHGVGLVVVGWGGVFVGLVGSPSPFDSWFLG
ncbi:hypothetical protein, partial [Corynebacterium felinum]